VCRERDISACNRDPLYVPLYVNSEVFVLHVAVTRLFTPHVALHVMRFSVITGSLCQNLAAGTCSSSDWTKLNQGQSVVTDMVTCMRSADFATCMSSKYPMDGFTPSPDCTLCLETTLSDPSNAMTFALCLTNPQPANCAADLASIDAKFVANCAPGQVTTTVAPSSATVTTTVAPSSATTRSGLIELSVATVIAGALLAL
jgi:hypothetical protein